MSELTVTGNRISVAAITASSTRNQIEDQVPVGRVSVPAVKTVAPEEKSVEISLDKNTRLSIERDEETGHYVFRSIDQQTGEVVAQYPTKEILAQIAQLRAITGLTVDEDA
jgi:uncharacterized FlaG/YvyC family protein